MRPVLAIVLAVVAAALGAATLAGADPGRPGSPAPVARAAAACADFSTQLAAQEAADTRDSDGDGIYCEELPCPCSGAWQAQHGTSTPASPPPASRASCTKPKTVVAVGISSTRYPAVIAHVEAAVKAGWPRVMTINRIGAEQRRARALRGWPTRRGYDRDEYPMAFARRSWRAHIAYVDSSQNRGAGSSIGLKLRRYCDGTRFKITPY